MRELIRRILREQTTQKKLRYGALSDDDKKNIKTKGREVFDRFKKTKAEAINKFFSEHGLFYGSPSKDFLKRNIEDITFALKNLPLTSNAKQHLNDRLLDLELQLGSIEKFERGEIKQKGRHYEYFHEIGKEDSENMKWSIVNLFDNNIMLWIQLINDWLVESNSEQTLNTIPEVINTYFAIENGNKAFKDIAFAMVDREKYREKITDKTWVGGQKVESDFVNKLISNGVNKDDIHVFSGEKNIVDGIGIDLAVKCDGMWIPVQVKSNEPDASDAIPFKGVSSFPYGSTFKIISKKGKDKIQSDIIDFCKSSDNEEKPKVKAPANVDYVSYMGWDKDSNK